MNRLSTLRDLCLFVVQRRKLILAPVLILLLLMAVFILVAEIPVLAPFIYAIF